MALSNSSYGSVSNCRLYVDYIQYAKEIGYVDNFEIVNLDGDKKSVWDYNPANVNTYSVIGNVDEIAFQIFFKNQSTPNTQFSQFLSTMNYYGVLGTDLGLFGVDTPFAGSPDFQCEVFNYAEGGTATEWIHSHGTPIVGTTDAETSVGYVIKDIDAAFLGSDWISSFRIALELPNEASAMIAEGTTIKVGSLIAGRYFDFPHSANLSMNIKRGYEGIKTKTTISGRSLSNISYYKQPDWGDYPAWTHIDIASLSGDVDPAKDLNFKPVAQNGRREWKLKWSYIDKKDMFPKSSEGTMGGIYDNSNGDFDGFDEGGVHQGNIMGWLTTFTMGLNIPMLFQPDKTKQVFAKVKANQKSISIQQSAPNLYTCKLKLTEVW